LLRKFRSGTLAHVFFSLCCASCRALWISHPRAARRNTANMRVYIKYEPPTDGTRASATLPSNLKIKLPASWLPGPVSRVKELFIEHYNKKHGAAISSDDFHVVSHQGVALSDSRVVQECIKEHDEIRIADGRPPSDAMDCDASTLMSAKMHVTDETERRICRNYGCMQKYADSGNHDTACQHHTGPPLFR